MEFVIGAAIFMIGSFFGYVYAIAASRSNKEVQVGPAGPEGLPGPPGPPGPSGKDYPG